MTSRTHIVLVPGFVGFDALGQLEYYAGVTDVFQRWLQAKDAAARHHTLHYFDNFPTASVATRAERLRDYLLKRVARGEFNGDDRVTLVGHSTGGLDIRKAVLELAKNPDQVAIVDGTHEVLHRDLLRHLEHLVFLSVPHYGTNLGDFGYKLIDTIQSLARDAGLALQLNREPIATWRRALERCVDIERSDLLRAIADALNESDEDSGADAKQRADEREARSELALWLEHMSRDFAVIGDLRSASGAHAGSESPAHFSQETRIDEMKAWKRYRISTQSYASFVPKRAGLASAPAAWLKPSAWALNRGAWLLNRASEPWWQASALSARAARVVLPALAVPPSLRLLRRYPDVVFKTFYALCGDPAGPFQVDAASIAPNITALASGQSLAVSDVLARDDSDGVVNTLSMLWPYEASDPARHPCFLVEADHADIIGHFAPEPVTNARPNGRAFDAYDIFPSGSGFDRDRFKAVWTHIFDSCP